MYSKSKNDLKTENTIFIKKRILKEKTKNYSIPKVLFGSQRIKRLVS